MVCLALPLKFTMAAGSNPLPLTVMLMALLPAVVREGVMLVVDGTAAMAANGIMPESNVATAATDANFLMFVMFIIVFLFN